jgi:hypothetical protein
LIYVGPDRYHVIWKKNIMIWTSAPSTFVLNMMCEFSKNGVSMENGFRLMELQVVAEVVCKFYGRQVHPKQIYNYQRHWRVGWV